MKLNINAFSVESFLKFTWIGMSWLIIQGSQLQWASWRNSSNSRKSYLYGKTVWINSSNNLCYWDTENEFSCSRMALVLTRLSVIISKWSLIITRLSVITSEVLIITRVRRIISTRKVLVNCQCNVIISRIRCYNY